ALRPARVSLAVFPSGRPLPSTASAPGSPGLFGGFVGSTDLSDFPRSFIEGLPPSVPLASRRTSICHPANHPGRGIINRPQATARSPGSRAWSSSCVPGFFDRAGTTSDSRITPPAMLPSDNHESVGSPNLEFRGSIAPPARFLSTLRCALTERQRMTRGHRNSLGLRCRAFPSPAPCRFIPALSMNVLFAHACTVPGTLPRRPTVHRADHLAAIDSL